MAAAVVVSTVSIEVLRPMRLAGPAVRRWGGYVLLGVGTWFAVLAVLPGPILGA